MCTYYIGSETLHKPELRASFEFIVIDPPIFPSVHQSMNLFTHLTDGSAYHVPGTELGVMSSLEKNTDLGLVLPLAYSLVRKLSSFKRTAKLLANYLSDFLNIDYENLLLSSSK